MNKAELIAEEKKLSEALLDHRQMEREFWLKVATRAQELIDDNSWCNDPLDTLNAYGVMPSKRVKIELIAEFPMTFDVEQFKRRIQSDTTYQLSYNLDNEATEVNAKVVSE